MAEQAQRQSITSWLERSGWTAAALAREAGFSAGAVSQVLAGNYAADDAPVLDALEEAIARIEARPAMQVLQTGVVAEVRKLITAVQVSRTVGVYAGAPGIGKTTALRHFHTRHSRSSALVRAYRAASTTEVLRRLVLALGERTPSRSTDGVLHTAIRQLRDRARVILIDEADTLRPATLDHLRTISDEAGVGLFLAGHTSLSGRLRRYAELDQLRDRITVWPSAREAISAKDARALGEMAAGQPLEADVHAALWGAAAGSARQIVNRVHSVRRVAESKGIGLSADLLQQVTAAVIGRQQVTPGSARLDDVAA